MESKTQLYNCMLATRRELKAEFIESASLVIQKRLLLMEQFRTAMRIGLYSAGNNEVRTDFLFTEADKNRKELYYPAPDEREGRLEFYRITDLAQLHPGDAGILRPDSGMSKLRDVNTLDVILVPGVAFDLRGGRLGFGEGYYDKCLLEFSGVRIALAYDFQVVSELPTTVRGQKVDWIATESRVIHCLRHA